MRRSLLPERLALAAAFLWSIAMLPVLMTIIRLGTPDNWFLEVGKQSLGIFLVTWITLRGLSLIFGAFRG